MRGTPYCAAILCSCVLSACVSLGRISGIEIDPAAYPNLPQRAVIKVALIPQNDTKSCATTSVAMAISYFEGRNSDPLDKEEVWRISGTSEVVVHTIGNDMAGLARIAKHYGYRSEYAQDLKLEQLEYLLSKGIPVMVNITPDPRKSATHALLIVGYDRNRRFFYLNDPSLVIRVMSFADFETRWFAYLSSPLGMARRSAFIVYPKEGWKTEDSVPSR